MSVTNHPRRISSMSIDHAPPTARPAGVGEVGQLALGLAVERCAEAATPIAPATAWPAFSASANSRGSSSTVSEPSSKRKARRGVETYLGWQATGARLQGPEGRACDCSGPGGPTLGLRPTSKITKIIRAYTATARGFCEFKSLPDYFEHNVDYDKENQNDDDHPAQAR